MTMLLIDAGNSRIKWALVGGQQWLHQGIVDNVQAVALHKTFSALPPPQKIIASCVAGQHLAQQLRAACAMWPVPVEFISAENEQCGVRNNYQHPAQLGSDRWAALIAARHLHRTACLVVNCGTATTVDALSAAGEFLGGLILPGLDMMRRSLAEYTAQLAEAKGEWRAFPCNTADAIASGTIQATAGAIHLQFAALASQGEARCILSGGAADLIQPHLNIPLVREDCLVLRGLQLIGTKG